MAVRRLSVSCLTQESQNQWDVVAPSFALVLVTGPPGHTTASDQILPEF